MGSDVGSEERGFELLERALPGGTRDPRRAALFMAAVHAVSAQRLRTSVRVGLDQMRAGQDGSDARVIGDASLAVVALHLAVAAVQRYRAVTGEPGPIVAPELDKLDTIARHLRSTVMHWEDKVDRSPDTYLVVNNRSVWVEAPEGRHSSAATVSGLDWIRFDSAMDRIRRWAEYQLANPAPENATPPPVEA